MSAYSSSIPVIITLALLITAAAHDIATRTVPNWISAGILAAGIVARLLAGDLTFGLVVALLVFAAAAALWRFGYMGGADAKLLGATALVTAPAGTPDLLILTTLAGGVLALAYLALARIVARPAPGRRRTLLGRLAKAECRRLSRRGPLPYATAIAAGSVMTLLPRLLG